MGLRSHLEESKKYVARLLKKDHELVASASAEDLMSSSRDVSVQVYIDILKRVKASQGSLSPSIAVYAFGDRRFALSPGLAYVQNLLTYYKDLVRIMKIMERNPVLYRKDFIDLGRERFTGTAEQVSVILQYRQPENAYEPSKDIPVYTFIRDCLLMSCLR